LLLKPKGSHALPISVNWAFDMRRVRTGILISGRGTNMAALIEATKAPDYPAEIVLVISNVEGAGGLAVAESNGIKVLTIKHRDFATREAFEAVLDIALTGAGVELICLAGFMRILSGSFIERWQGHLLNIHPSLLPQFRGLHTHEQALSAGVKTHGCTVHYVVPELDAGPSIAQSTVPVFDGDTADTLASRVLAEEIKLYPSSLAKIAKSLSAL
jgi:phosphoribosylglycinamide formyltransferase-1